MKSIADRVAAEDPAAAQAPAPAAPGGPAPAAAGPQAAVPGEAGATGGEEQASPEEQKDYERVVVAGVDILYNDKTHEQIATMLKNGADRPAQTLAQLAVTMITQIDEQSGNTVPEEVLFAPIAEFIEQAGELANTMGAFKVDEGLLNRAAQQAMLQLGDEYGITPEEIQEWLAELPPGMVNEAVAQQMQYAQAGQGQAAPAEVDPTAQPVQAKSAAQVAPPAQPA